jgi:mannosyl-oligosaccharide glucosidase
MAAVLYFAYPLLSGGQSAGGAGAGTAATPGAKTGSGGPVEVQSMSRFSAAHNESLLWGTFRPGVYFGAKSRTLPESVVAGLMWGSVGSDGSLNENTMRYTCEESNTNDGLVFGYKEHDGSAYATQTITDPKNGLKLDTTFVKAENARDWTMRVSGKAKAKKVVYYHLGVDTEHAAKGAYELSVDADGVISGKTANLGAFSLRAVVKGSAVAGSVVAASAGEIPLDKMKTSLLATLAGPPKRPGQPAPPPGVLAASRHGGRANVIHLQFTVESDFEIDFVFLGAAASAASPAAAEQAAAALSGPALDATILARSLAFADRFDQTFHLADKGFAESDIVFARAAMSAQLGGLGFFFGKSEIHENSGGGATSLRPLFTSVPSRSFFPRGFLWDEGFHQLLIGKWDPKIRRDVLSHWLATQDGSGWIPREQILGAEARSKVPDWAVPQHRTHANPPVFLIVVEELLDAADAAPGSAQSVEDVEWLKGTLPALEQWYNWFLSTQAGLEKSSFFWHGRDKNDGKLNAMTLSSGLDDYPRSSSVSKDERHVDLLCWMAMGADVMARAAARTGVLREGAAEKYKGLHKELAGTQD